jgi:HEAT repeats
LKKMTDMLLPRLKDKVPGVRVLAVRALGNLQSEGDGITEELLRLLQRDSSKEVRIAAVDCICLSKITLPLVIARVKDVKPEVRIAVYNRLSAKGMVSAKVSLI